MPTPSRRLPERPSLEHLRHEARQRLRDLRVRDATARLAQAQLLVAREYGFASWRQLKATVDGLTRDRAFAAARAGDLDSVRRALESGLDPGVTDATGQSLHQVAKTRGHRELELLLRDRQEREDRPAHVHRAVTAIHAAADAGRVDDLRRLLDDHPDLLDARGVDRQRQTALHRAARHDRLACVSLLLDAGADVSIRDHGDNASALHWAAHSASLEVVRALVEAGADVIGGGDDHHVGVLGWATCLGRVRPDVAEYLLGAGARLDLWSAIALGRADEVRRLVRDAPSGLGARMSRNEHRRSPLHHAAAMNRPDMVRLLLGLGADAAMTDDTGVSVLATAARAHADPAVLALLEAAGAPFDLLAALRLERYGAAEQMLREDPARIGPDGRDTIALHLLVADRHEAGVAWLIAHGVDVNARRRLWDCEATALHVTAEHGGVAVARRLLDAGADPGIRDDKYEATVLGWAEYCDQPEIAALLRERGATA